MTTFVTEQEAAAYLDLTVRTLRNYRAKGRLPFREIKGKTRPLIEYQQSDLDRLKSALEKRRQRSKKPTEGKPPLPRITFSLPGVEYEELIAEATKYGQTPSEYARHLLRTRMETKLKMETAELRSKVDTMNAEMRKMRKEFSLAFESVLEFSGLSAQDAKKWVNENLR